MSWLDDILNSQTVQSVGEWLGTEQGGKATEGLFNLGLSYGAQALGLNDPQIDKTGYLGEIPRYDAVRERVPGTYDPLRRPGSSGQRYFTDTQFLPRGSQPAGLGAAGLSALNLSNLARQTRPVAPVTTPVPVTTNLVSPAPLARGGIVGFQNKGAVTKEGGKRGDKLYNQNDLSDKEYEKFLTAFPDWRTLFNSKEWDRSPMQGHVLNNVIATLKDAKGWRANLTPKELRSMTKFGGPGNRQGIGEIPDTTGLAYEKTSRSPPGQSYFPDRPNLWGDMGQHIEVPKSAPQYIENVPLGADIGEVKRAKGGIVGLRQGKYVNGATSGMADAVPANIEGTQEARLSDGEFVVPADVVSHLGNGNSDAGADELYDMMDRIRKARTGTTKQAKEIDPREFLPA